MGAASDIERLIELGLNRYGAGDLDGALLMWEEALAIDPDNQQAASYVDYVRLNYELLTENQPEVSHGDAEPFAIEEEPEYQIEITPGELVARESQPVVAEQVLDAGWFDDDAAEDPGGRLATQPSEAGPPAFELEPSLSFEPSLSLEPLPSPEEPALALEQSAEPEEPVIELEQSAEPEEPVIELAQSPAPDEPALEHAQSATPGEPVVELERPPELESALGQGPEPPPLELEADEPPPMPEVNFDEATREYFGSTIKPAMPSGNAEPVPLSHVAETGAAQPSPGTIDAPAEDSGATEFGNEYTGGFTSEGTPLGFQTQETEIRKRDFGFVHPAEPSTGSAATMDFEKTRERTPFSQPSPREEDLLASLPTPRPAIVHQAEVETQDLPLVASQTATEELPNPKAATRELPGSQRLPSKSTPPKTTREMPDATRPPARRDSAELSQAQVVRDHARTQDFNPVHIDIGAPTRELGLRPAGKPPQLSNPDDEDAPTKQSDVRAIRQAAMRGDGRAGEADVEGTQSDVALTLDPVEARAAQILDEVDANAPDHEAAEDQTRRRITTLLERAVAWNQEGDTERAVAAVDLAMSEDPNSALAQKLLTRHRDAMLTVFQGYIGDLERMPQLTRPLHELQDAGINPRAAFLLSRIDGALTIDELLDVSGMPRMEAFRYICQLYLRGILR